MHEANFSISMVRAKRLGIGCSLHDSLLQVRKIIFVRTLYVIAFIYNYKMTDGNRNFETQSKRQLHSSKLDVVHSYIYLIAYVNNTNYLCVLNFLTIPFEFFAK